MIEGNRRVVLFVGGSIMPFCRFRRSLIRTLVENHNCHVICAYWGDSGDGIFAPFEMPGVSWADLGGNHATPPGRGDLGPLRRLTRLIRRHRPDTICCFNAKPIVLTPAIIRLVHPQARIVALMEGLGSALSFLLREDAGPKRWLFRNLTRCMDQWVLLNPRDAALIGRLHGHMAEKIAVVPGVGTNTRRFFPAADPLAARRLVFVGRLVQEKGIGFFLDLARHLKRRGSDWRLAIAGLPAAQGKITSDDIQRWLDEGCVESCGPVSNMPEFYRNASALIFPSVYEEGLPAAIMEAQSSGLPCLVRDTPAMQNTIVEGQTGFLLPDNDPELWAERLDRLCDPKLFTDFSRAARRHASEVYDRDRINARLSSILLEDKETAPRGYRGLVPSVTR
ncbi:glycosyltransferase [Tropicimonas sp.]|uniref:glycosyltransferase n=1 Tax=Tropicimonas sp. TaxID=2067044 RepID=UPI003A8512E7